MGKTCAICKAKSPHLSFHRFPENHDLRQTWIEKCSVPPGKVTRTTFICNQHFRESDYDTFFPQAKLKKGAVPSLGLPNGENTDMEHDNIVSPNATEQPQYSAFHENASVPSTSVSKQVSELGEPELQGQSNIETPQVGSRKLVASEKKELSHAVTSLATVTAKLATHMAVDYALFWILDLIRFYGRFQSKVQAPNIPKVHISGEGFLADLLKGIVHAFQPMGVELEIDTVPCLPSPIPPDYDRYIQIAIVMAFCWILTALEPYGLRFRNHIMCYYHPYRAKERAIWLYNHILRSRSSFLKFARRQLRRKMFGTKGIEKVTLKEFLRSKIRSPYLRLCLGADQQEACLVCGEVFRESDEKMPIRCMTPGCKGIYCEECFRDLHNLCTVCMSPIDYGDMTDISEEKDSSEEEIKPKKITEPKGKTKKSKDSDYYSSDDPTDYSDAYQYEKKTSSVPPQPSTPHFKDVEKQSIPDYASMESFKNSRGEKYKDDSKIVQFSSISQIIPDDKKGDVVEEKIIKKRRIDEGTLPKSKVSVGTSLSGKNLPSSKPKCMGAKFLDMFGKPRMPRLRKPRKKSEEEIPLMPPPCLCSSTDDSELEYPLQHGYLEDSLITLPRSDLSLNLQQLPLLDYNPNIQERSSVTSSFSSIDSEIKMELMATEPIVPKLDLSSITESCPCRTTRNTNKFSHVKLEVISESSSRASSSRESTQRDAGRTPETWELPTLPQQSTTPDKNVNVEPIPVNIPSKNALSKKEFSSTPLSSARTSEIEHNQKQKVREYYKSTNYVPTQTGKPAKKKNKVMRFFQKLIPTKKCNKSSLPLYEADNKEIIEIKSFNYSKDRWDTLSSGTSSPPFPPRHQVSGSSENTNSPEDKKQCSQDRIRGGECTVFHDSSDQTPAGSLLLPTQECDQRILPNYHTASARTTKFLEQYSNPLDNTEILAKYFISIEDLTPTRDIPMKQFYGFVESEVSNGIEPDFMEPPERDIPREKASSNTLYFENTSPEKLSETHEIFEISPSGSSSALSEALCANILGKPCINNKIKRRSNSSITAPKSKESKITVEKLQGARAKESSHSFELVDEKNNFSKSSSGSTKILRTFEVVNNPIDSTLVPKNNSLSTSKEKNSTSGSTYFTAEGSIDSKLKSEKSFLPIIEERVENNTSNKSHSSKKNTLDSFEIVEDRKQQSLPSPEGQTEPCTSLGQQKSEKSILPIIDERAEDNTLESYSSKKNTLGSFEIVGAEDNTLQTHSSKNNTAGSFEIVETEDNTLQSHSSKKNTLGSFEIVRAEDNTLQSHSSKQNTLSSFEIVGAEDNTLQSHSSKKNTLGSFEIVATEYSTSKRNSSGKNTLDSFEIVRDQPQQIQTGPESQSKSYTSAGNNRTTSSTASDKLRSSLTIRKPSYIESRENKERRQEFIPRSSSHSVRELRGSVTKGSEPICTEVASSIEESVQTIITQEILQSQSPTASSKLIQSEKIISPKPSSVNSVGSRFSKSPEYHSTPYPQKCFLDQVASPEPSNRSVKSNYCELQTVETQFGKPSVEKESLQLSGSRQSISKNLLIPDGQKNKSIRSTSVSIPTAATFKERISQISTGQQSRSRDFVIPSYTKIVSTDSAFQTDPLGERKSSQISKSYSKSRDLLIPQNTKDKSIDSSFQTAFAPSYSKSKSLEQDPPFVERGHSRNFLRDRPTRSMDSTFQTEAIEASNKSLQTAKHAQFKEMEHCTCCCKKDSYRERNNRETPSCPCPKQLLSSPNSRCHFEHDRSQRTTPDFITSDTTSDRSSRKVVESMKFNRNSDMDKTSYSRRKKSPFDHSKDLSHYRRVAESESRSSKCRSSPCNCRSCIRQDFDVNRPKHHLRKGKHHRGRSPKYTTVHKLERTTYTDYESSSSDSSRDCLSSYSQDDINIFDLPYQSNDEYLELVQELEEKLVNRNRCRVKKAMEEFERRSRFNKPLERPLFNYDETSESEEPILQKISKFKPSKSKTPFQSKSRFCDNISEEDESSWDDETSNIVKKMAKRLESHPERLVQHCPRNEGCISKSHWQMNPRTGDWYKIGEESSVYKQVKYRPRTPSPKYEKYSFDRGDEYCDRELCSCHHKHYRN